MNFEAFKFHPQIAAGITAAGYKTPTPIQTKAIPKVMQGSDLMGLAQTGTGKTAVFVLPILHRLLKGQRRNVRALIIAPTRELAEQIHQTIEVLGSKTGLRSVTAYGGVGIHPQIQQLKNADIVVACPGRLLDHINRKTVDLSKLEVLVLDEADQMFDMGFLPDIRRILKHLPQSNRQTLLFSATMPSQIRSLADDILNNSVRVQVGNEAPADTVSHAFYPVARHLKTALLLQLLKNTSTKAVLIFTRTKHRARQLGEKLSKAGYQSTSLQGNLSQARRQDAMNGFKSGKYKVLVATDIAARGIDVSNVSHVINYDMPSTPETYIHRIGRTGRVQRTGEAFTLITAEDKQMVKAIHGAIGMPVEQRTLADFNYHAPTETPTPPRKQGSVEKQPKDRQTPPTTGRKPNRRSAKGAFAWFSPQKPRMADRSSRPTA
ncbi:MAG: DEAD/DEAH box helicase [Proteobacteria bacterium]|nr:DEAD/DEAH box helicase [Pseudomonadota bacterium]